MRRECVHVPRVLFSRFCAICEISKASRSRGSELNTPPTIMRTASPSSRRPCSQSRAHSPKSAAARQANAARRVRARCIRVAAAIICRRALLTPSAMLTAGQYLSDIKAARRGLDDVAPLIVRDSTEGFEAARITIRKEPVNGIRKACSKIIMLLPEGSAGRKEKDKIYESIKKNLETLDNGMRPEAKERPDNLALLKTVQMELDAFSEGLGIAAADPPAPPPPPPPAAAAPPPTTTADEDLAALRARLAELNALQSQ